MHGREHSAVFPPIPHLLHQVCFGTMNTFMSVFSVTFIAHGKQSLRCSLLLRRYLPVPKISYFKC